MYLIRCIGRSKSAGNVSNFRDFYIRNCNGSGSLESSSEEWLREIDVLIGCEQTGVRDIA